MLFDKMVSHDVKMTVLLQHDRDMSQLLYVDGHMYFFVMVNMLFLVDGYMNYLFLHHWDWDVNYLLKVLLDNPFSMKESFRDVNNL